MLMQVAAILDPEVEVVEVSFTGRVGIPTSSGWGVPIETSDLASLTVMLCSIYLGNWKLELATMLQSSYRRKMLEKKLQTAIKWK